MATPPTGYNKDCGFHKEFQGIGTYMVKEAAGIVHRVIITGTNKGNTKGAITLWNGDVPLIPYPAELKSDAYEVGIWFDVNIRVELTNADDQIMVVFT